MLELIIFMLLLLNFRLKKDNEKLRREIEEEIKMNEKEERKLRKVVQVEKQKCFVSIRSLLYM